MPDYPIKEIQSKILTIMVHVDQLCRKHGITYYMMGGTAIGAVRHKGFIPWDDDLDIFMTPDNYEKFKTVFARENDGPFTLQEWRLGCSLLEYAKVRMNGTTFIEPNFRHDSQMHHGVYIDIMILHKCPKRTMVKKILFLLSRYVTAQALLERNWKPKTSMQSFVLTLVRLLPKHFLSGFCYRLIYRYDKRPPEDYEFCYFLTKASFKRSIFPKEMFAEAVDVPFETTKLLAPTDIHGYLKIRFGDYLKLPSESERQAARHADIVDMERDYKEYF